MSETKLSRILRVGLINPIPLDEIDPVRIRSQEAALITAQIFDTPFSQAFGSGGIEANLATELEPSAANPRISRLHLRDDLCFSDGRELRATDVLDSLGRLANDQPDVELSIEDESITIQCGRKSSSLDLLLSDVNCAVARYTSGSVVGTGTFRLHPDSEPSRIRLVRNPYDRRRCNLEEIRFEAFPLDDDGRSGAIIEAFHRKQIDLSFAVPRDGIGQLQGVRKQIAPGLSTAVLALNMRRPALADRRVRQAIAYSLDRYEISKVCNENPLAFKATGLLPRGMAIQDDGLELDPERARELIAARPVSEPMTLLPIWCPRPYLPEPLEVAEKIAAQLSQIGIEISIRPVADSLEFFKRVVAGKDDLILAGWMADNSDPWAFLTALLDSRRLTRLDGMGWTANHGAYQSPAMDRLLESYRQGPEAETLSQITDLLHDEVPVVPLMYGAQTVVSSYRVQGLGRCLVPVLPLRALELAPP